MIIKLLNGNILQMSKEESDYLIWSKLSPELKRQIRNNKAKSYLSSGPNITNLWNAFQAYIGNRDPENPNLQTGDVPNPGFSKQGITGLHKMMFKLPEAKQTLLAPLAGRSRAASIIKDKNIVEALKHRDEVYRRWASLYKQEHNPTPTTFRTNPAKIKRLETDVSKTNGKTLAGGKAHAGGSYSPKSHTIRVTSSNNTSAKNLEDIAFHEGIHSYGLGESPSYAWKSKYLNFPEGTNPYFLDPKEIATHGIQQGQNLGIKVGQPYPGKEAMIEMIENRPEGLGFGGVPMILYNNAKTNTDYRRLWSLLNGTFKDGGIIKAANARKWKHENGGILKGLYGLIIDVDRRRDTTGKGIGSMPFFGSAKFGSSDSPLALFYGSKEGGPQLRDKFGPQTGFPNILPGMVGKTGLNQYVLLMEKEAPNMFKLIAENPKSLRHLLSMGYGRIREGLKNFFKTGNKESLKELEDWAKRNLNIFVNKGEPSSITPKGNLNYPSMENVDYTARGWTRPKLSSDQLWNGYTPEEFEGLEGIDRIITYHKKGGKAFHTGVNVLDSNPKMSKAASRRVIKAQEGTNKVGIWSRIGLALNSDTSKAIINIGSNAISSISQIGLLNKAKAELNEAGKAHERKSGNLAAENANVDGEVNLYMNELYNQGDNGGSIVRNYIRELLKNKARLKAISEAQQEVNEKNAMFDQLYNLQISLLGLNLTGSITNLVGGIVNNNKKLTVDNGAPSLTSGNSYLDAMLFLKLNGII